MSILFLCVEILCAHTGPGNFESGNEIRKFNVSECNLCSVIVKPIYVEPFQNQQRKIDALGS